MSNGTLTLSAQRPGVASLIRRVGSSREFGVALVLIALVIVTTSLNQSFLLGAGGVRDFLLNPVILVLLAISQSLTLITRNIDLSVSSTLGLGAWFTGTLVANFSDVPLVVVAIGAIVFGALLGSINGMMVAFAGAPALVVTLGTLYAYRGINVLWSDGKVINATDLPPEFRAFGVGTIFGIPKLAIIALVLVLIVAAYMRYRSSARELYALGSEPAAAGLLGIAQKRRIFTVFLLSGSIAGLAGFLYAARYGAVTAQAGTGMELTSVAAAVLGGVAIFGGSGTVWGAAIGAVLLTTINRALPTLGIADFWQKAVVGLLILAAIILDRVLAWRHELKLAAEREEK